MGGSTLEKTKEEKDLGVTITDNLKAAAKCAKAARTEQAVLGQITRHFVIRTSTHLYSCTSSTWGLIWSSVQAWSPCHQAGKEALEKVQRKAVGMVSGLQGAEYEQQLKELGLTTLEERRHQSHMLYMYRICHEKDGSVRADWFEPTPPATARMRQHADPLNVRPLHRQLDIRRNFFSVQAGKQWNAIPRTIKRAKMAASFKKQYAAFRDEMIVN
jgi:hypothetical protein